MGLQDVLVSHVHITEDEYSYKSSFILSDNNTSRNLDLSDLDVKAKLEEIKNLFELNEALEEIRKYVFDAVLLKSSISSKNVEGEHYEEDKKNSQVEKSANSMDLA